MIKRWVYVALAFGLGMSAMSCENQKFNDVKVDVDRVHVDELSPEMIKVRDYVPEYAVIAHRGSTFWTPEETESAYRWAREIGADYLECDMQVSKDGVVLALHDDNLKRTTNIETVFGETLPREIRKNLYALAAFIGDATDFALPGDNTGLEKTKNDLIAMKREEEEQGFLRGSNVFERGWESIAENGSLWIAEQMGRKLVQLPLAVAMSLVPSLGALTGMAVLDVCSDLYGEILYRTGKGEPLETLTFGVPLGLMQLLVPTRIPVRQVTRPKEVAQRLWRMVLQGMVHGVQKEQMDHVLKRVEERDKKNEKENNGK